MNKNTEMLIKEFKRITNKGWIKSVSKSTGSIGLTFEQELNKKPDNSYLPDYHDIEIKCTSFYSIYPIGLFSISFDGPTFPEINRIVEKYGYYDNTYNNQKILRTNINNKRPSIINNKYIFKLDVDYTDKKIYLCVYDLDYNLIERESYIYIDNLYKHINTKLKKIAIIYGNKVIKNNNTYFRYYRMCIYKLNNAEKILLALKEGTITAQLAVSTYKNGYREGKPRDRNLSFRIDKKNIGKIFDEIYVCEEDKN